MCQISSKYILHFYNHLFINLFGIIIGCLYLYRRTLKAIKKMESKVNPAIETFYKAFPIFNNRTVYVDMVVYSKQTYRTEDTLIQAQELVNKLKLPLKVIYNSRTYTLSVKLV